ncbi:MAG: shikimate kinase [Pseudomonadota bacterium]
MTEQRPRQAPGAEKTATRALTQSIVMIGLMGAGKTSVGTRLAAMLGAGFIDSDHEIEAAAGRTIAEIFEEFGEPYFRAGERRVISRLLSGPPKVIATGGGAFMDAETRGVILAEAVSVWLRADLDVLVARTAGRTHRPLLNSGDPREILSGLIDARYPIYAEADVAVDSQLGQTHEQMAARIIAALEAEGRAFAGAVS